MYSFRVPKSPKLSIFLGLAGLSSTFGNPRHILIGVPPGAGDNKFLLLFESKMKRRKIIALLCALKVKSGLTCRNYKRYVNKSRQVKMIQFECGLILAEITRHTY